MKSKFYIFGGLGLMALAVLSFSSTPVMTPYHIVENMDTAIGRIEYENFREKVGLMLGLEVGIGLLGLLSLIMGFHKKRKPNKTIEATA